VPDGDIRTLTLGQAVDHLTDFYFSFGFAKIYPLVYSIKPMGIFVNGREAFFAGHDLPILISGKEGSGASFFSTCLIADFLRRGHKILFFSAFPAAKMDLMRQMSDMDRECSEFIRNGETIQGKRAIILDSGEEKDILEEIKRVNDLNERIIFFKNMDKYSQALFDAVGGSERLILSGDVDKCCFMTDITRKRFSTLIFFSKPECYRTGPDFDKLKKFQGLVKGVTHNGAVEVIEKPAVESLDYRL
jgi:hypothetical protein